MALFQNNVELNEIADHIFILLDIKTLSNLENINTIWSRQFRDPKLWLKLCMKKEAKWFKYRAQDSNQNLIQYEQANFQWYQLLEGLDNSPNEELKESLLSHFKIRFKTASKLNGSFTSIYSNPFAFAAKSGNLALAKYIVTNTDPFKKMKRSAMIDIEQGEILDDEIIPFDPSLIPIHTAAMFGQVEVVKFLMETYSHLNDTVDEFNHTPIEYAIIKDHRNVLKLLLSFPMKGIIKKKALNLALAKPSYTMAFKIYKWRTACIIFERVLHYERGGYHIILTILIILFFIISIMILIKFPCEYYCLQSLNRGGSPTSVLCQMGLW